MLDHGGRRGARAAGHRGARELARPRRGWGVDDRTTRCWPSGWPPRDSTQSKDHRRRTRRAMSARSTAGRRVDHRRNPDDTVATVLDNRGPRAARPGAGRDAGHREARDEAESAVVVRGDRSPLDTFVAARLVIDGLQARQRPPSSRTEGDERSTRCWSSVWSPASSRRRQNPSSSRAEVDDRSSPCCPWGWSPRGSRQRRSRLARRRRPVNARRIDEPRQPPASRGATHRHFVDQQLRWCGKWRASWCWTPREAPGSSAPPLRNPSADRGAAAVCPPRHLPRRGTRVDLAWVGAAEAAVRPLRVVRPPDA